MFKAYDGNEHISNIYSDIVSATTKIIIEQHDKLLPYSSDVEEVVPFGISTSAIKIPLL
jgi:hypothetical protein